MGGILWRRMQDLMNHLRNRLIVMCARTARAKLVMQPSESLLAEPASPKADGRIADSTARGNFTIRQSVRREQDDAYAPHQRMGQRA